MPSLPPVPPLATLQALSPHQALLARKVEGPQALVWKLWERGGHQKLTQVVCVGGMGVEWVLGFIP